MAKARWRDCAMLLSHGAYSSTHRRAGHLGCESRKVRAGGERAREHLQQTGGAISSITTLSRLLFPASALFKPQAACLESPCVCPTASGGEEQARRGPEALSVPGHSPSGGCHPPSVRSPRRVRPLLPSPPRASAWAGAAVFALRERVHGACVWAHESPPVEGELGSGGVDDTDVRAVVACWNRRAKPAAAS